MQFIVIVSLRVIRVREHFGVGSKMSVGYRHCHGLMAAVICQAQILPSGVIVVTMSSRAEQLRRIAREQKAQQFFELSDEIFELLMAMSPMQSRMEIIAYQHFHFDGGDWHGIYHANRTVLRVLRTPELGNSNFANVLRLHGFAYGDFLFSPSSE